MADLYRPALVIHPATLGQLFIPRQGLTALDHVMIAGVAAATYLHVWTVNSDPTLASGVLASPLAVGLRRDRIVIPASQPLTPIVLGVPVEDAWVADPSAPGGRRSVGGVVVALSAAENGTGNPAAATEASYRWQI